MSAPSLLLAADLESCCEGETWKPVPDWPHEASTCGRVRSVDRLGGDGIWRLGAMLPPRLDRRPGKGYVYVDLCDGPRRRKAAVHVLVLEAHAGLKPGPEYEGCHRYGIRDDNHRDGLYWGTKVQNRADRERHRLERAVTEAAPVTLDLSQEGGFPSVAQSRHCHGASVTGESLRDTGSFPPFQSFSSHFTSVQPIFRTLRTPFRSLRNRQAA